MFRSCPGISVVQGGRRGGGVVHVVEFPAAMDHPNTIDGLRFAVSVSFWPFRHMRAESAAKESEHNQCVACEWLGPSKDLGDHAALAKVRSVLEIRSNR
jgi:hypothetical protein